MEPLYAALVQRLMLWSAPDLDELRQRWSSFNLDEYLGLPTGDPRRYSTYMSRHLGEPLQLPPETLHLPSGGAADAHGAAQAYAAELNACGGVGVQLLGLGNNGHVGFNEPPRRLISLVTWWIYRMPPGDRIQRFLEEILRRYPLRRSPLASTKFWRRMKFTWW